MNDEIRITNDELPESWTTFGFTSAFDIQGGTQPPKSTFVYEPTDGYVQLLQIRDFGARPVPTFIRDARGLKKCKKEDVLIARYGASLGRILTGLEGAYNVAMAKVVIPPGIDRRFTLYLLNSEAFQNPLMLVSRSAQNGFNKEDLAKFQLPLAPLAEQKRIADKLEAVLGRVDACRARLARVPALLKRFRQSVLAAATSGKLTEEWRMTNGVNDEWEETQIQHVANVGTGSTPLRSNSAFFAPKGTPWVTSAATSQKLVTESEEFVTDAAIKAHRLKKYPVGTLLVAMYGEGKTRGQVTELGIEATINQACAAIYVDESIITKRFVKFSLEANYLEMRELAEGGNQPNLNLSKIKEFPIGLPTLPEQQEIVRRVEDLFAFADRIEARLATAQKTVERLTPATLAKAFRGELVPQDPNDEPASKLLNRIRERTSVMPQSLKRKSSISNGKNNKPTKMKSNESKSIMATLYNSDEPLSASELFALCGYPGDSDTKCVESFFVEIRAALDSRLITKERIGDEDFFQITQS